MRWRIPLVAALALFVAFGCQDMPVEPTPDANLNTPLLKAEVTHGYWSFTDEFDLIIPCGGVDELAHVVLGGQVQYSMTEDANGGVHSRGTIVTKGTALGEFGSRWTIHEAWPTTFYITPDGDDRVYNDNYISMWVGKGHAPSWNDWGFYKWTMNANGEVTVDRYSNRTECD